jgi:hypothetical protein
MASTQVFISYRRSDSPREAARIEELLRVEWGGVFRNVSDIVLGNPLPPAIRKALDQAGFVIVVIGPNWLDAANGHGERRLHDPRDMVRREIRYALKRIENDEPVQVIPVLVRHATMPARNTLPYDIEVLAELEAFSVSENSFELDVYALSDALARLKSVQSQGASDSLDEVDQRTNATPDLPRIVSLKPEAAGNPYLHAFPEYAAWECSLAGVGPFVTFHLNTRQSGHFDGELVRPRRVGIKGTWRLDRGPHGSLALILNGSTVDNSRFNHYIIVNRRSAETSYSGRDAFGRSCRMQVLRRLDVPSRHF